MQNPSTQIHLRSTQSGVAYLGLLLVITLLSIAAMATARVYSLQERRQAEEELLFIGSEFQAALTSYANASGLGMPRAPKSLNDLLLDKRTSTPRRHLRKIYLDPMTKAADWSVVLDEKGGVVGIHSSSALLPIKMDNFTVKFAQFKSSQSYREWVFAILLR